MENTEDTFSVSWVIGGINMNVKIDLEEIEKGIEDDKWEDAKSQPGTRIRLWDDSSEFVTFFSTGSCIVGARNVDRVDEMKDDVLNELKKIGVLSEDFEVETEINNVVAKADIGGELDLIPLQVHLGYENTEYEPEQFPGLVYNLCCTVMVFSSGKVILTGGKTVEENMNSYEDLLRTISKYKKEEKETPWSY